MALSRLSGPMRDRSHVQIETHNNLEPEPRRVVGGSETGHCLGRAKRGGTSSNLVQYHANFVLEIITLGAVVGNADRPRGRVVGDGGKHVKATFRIDDGGRRPSLTVVGGESHVHTRT